MKHVVMFSGGITSWAAAKRVAAQHGTREMTLLFADTGVEDEDLYRFLEEAATNIGAPLVRIAEGRTPFQVFKDVRFLGNSRVDPCSKILKRQLLGKWLKENCDPQQTLVAMGFDWSEEHRLQRLRQYDTTWQRWAPLLNPPWQDKNQLIAQLRVEGIEPPRLYELGFQHNNCGGACVKAGQAAWALLLREFPERYWEWETNEASLRTMLGKNVTILKDRRCGTTRPMTLTEFRTTQCATNQYDMMDWGSCGCFEDGRKP